MLILSSEFVFDCNISYTMKSNWYINKSSSQTLTYRNPSFESTQLVIQSNTLEYGLYEFVFQVKFTNMYTNETLSASDQTFIQIITSGLVVSAFKNGVSSIFIGSNQSLYLKPVAYSFDYDRLASIDSLNFEFYCQTINLNSYVSYQSLISLLSYKNSPVLTMNSNKTCFASQGKI